jgi:hypothetical protein
MVKSLRITFSVFLLAAFLAPALALAQGNSAAEELNEGGEAGFKYRCDNLPKNFPPCADSPSECGTNDAGFEPFNCLFIQEPIGGRPGYDLYKSSCDDEGQCKYVRWDGGAIVGTETGPFQAILAYEEGKEHEGPFSLLYNYLGLVYNFLSGIIIGFVVLVAVIGGIRMTTSGGNQDAFSQGRKMIIKALIGMVLWFTASVILYTINPTFFAF